MNTTDTPDSEALLARTISYYDANAPQYAALTASLDLQTERHQFVELLPPARIAGERHRVLDAGCGSGRDTLAFSAGGLQVTAFDGSEQLAQQARSLTGLPVIHMRFEDMQFREEFDGVWACASLLHLPPEELDETLERITRALRDDGAFYACFKVGEGCRSDVHGRYYHDFTPERLRNYLSARNFDVTAVTVSANSQEPGLLWANAFARKRA